jgi:hypothetical protein
MTASRDETGPGPDTGGPNPSYLALERQQDRLRRFT